MMKRSVFLALAAGMIATVAFTAPAQAGSYLVTTTAYFALTPATATTTEVKFVYQDGASAALTSITGITELNAGGLKFGGTTPLSYTLVGTTEIDVTFDPANATNGTIGPPPTPGLQFQFMGTAKDLSNDIFLKSMTLVLGPGTTAAQSVSVSVTPEPASWALLGIGMTGFLAYRRYFKKSSAA